MYVFHNGKNTRTQRDRGLVSQRLNYRYKLLSHKTVDFVKHPKFVLKFTV